MDEKLLEGINKLYSIMSKYGIVKDREKYNLFAIIEIINLYKSGFSEDKRIEVINLIDCLSRNLCVTGGSILNIIHNAIYQGEYDAIITTLSEPVTSISDSSTIVSIERKTKMFTDFASYQEPEDDAYIVGYDVSDNRETRTLVSNVVTVWEDLDD